MLTAQNVLDSGLFVGFVVARLGIGATQARTIVVQHDIDGDIKVDGDDLRRRPFVERKAALAKLLLWSRDGIQYVEHAEGHIASH